MATSVAFSNLNSWLQSQAANTKDTPYAITITGLTDSCQVGYNSGSLSYILQQNSTKYVDLSTTTLTASNVSYCFSNCTNLIKPPIISSSVSNMEECFSGCSNLVQAPTIPLHVSDVERAFKNCTSLTTTPTFNDGDSSLRFRNTFEGCTSLKTVSTLPNRITDMMEAFRDCTSLTTVTNIPTGAYTYKLTDLHSTFWGCKKLTNIPSIPSNIKYLIQTFYGCTSLTQCTIDSRTEVPQGYYNYNQTFEGCTGLTTVYYNASFDSFSQSFSQSYMFKGCSSIKKIYSNNPYLAKIRLSSTGLTSSSDTWEFRLYSSPASIAFSSLANDLATLVAGETHNIKVTGLTASNIGSANTSGTLGNVIRASGKTVNISSTSLPSKTDYSAAFYQCDKITAFPALPSNVTNLTDTFAGTNASSYPAIPSTVTNMTRTFEACHLMTSAPALPSNLTTLNSTFKSCTKITSAPTIPSKVTTMYRAFMSCTALTSAPTIPASVTTLESAFEGCSKLATLPAIGSGVTSIKAAFKGTKCTAIPTIPAKVTNAESAFENCTSLVTVAKVPSTITNGKSMFKGCTALTTINQFLISKDNLVNISNYKDMFSGDTALANVKVPDTPQYAQADKWRLILLNIAASAVSGRIYNPDKTTVNIASTSITKTSLILPVLTDELLFSQETFNNLAAICVNIIAKRYGYYNKTVINPEGKSFVLFADNQTNIATNLIDDNNARNTTLYSSNKVNSQIHSKIPDNNTAKGLVSSKTDNAIARWDGTAGKLQNSGVTINDSNVISGGSLNNVANVGVALSNGVTCSTAAETAAKTVALTGFVLRKGAKLLVNVSKANTSATALTLNVNGTGAKTIRANGTVTSTSYYTLAAGWYNCYYDGTYWNMDSANEAQTARNSMSANDIIAYCSTAAATAAKTASLPNFRLASGQRILLHLLNENTAASAITLNVNGTGAKTIRIQGATVTSASYYKIPKGIYMAHYDGTYWNLYNIINLSTSTAFNGSAPSTSGASTFQNFFSGAIGVKAWNFTTTGGYIVYTNGLIIQMKHIEKTGLGTFSTTWFFDFSAVMYVNNSPIRHSNGADGFGYVYPLDSTNGFKKGCKYCIDAGVGAFIIAIGY